MFSDVGSVSLISHGSGSVVENVVVLSVGPLQSQPTKADVVAMEARNTTAGIMLLLPLFSLERVLGASCWNLYLGRLAGGGGGGE